VVSSLIRNLLKKLMKLSSGLKTTVFFFETFVSTYKSTRHTTQKPNVDRIPWFARRLTHWNKISGFSSGNILVKTGLEYETLSDTALTVLTAFVFTCPCEAGFSIMVNIKTSGKSNLDLRHDLKCALPVTKPVLTLTFRISSETC
jgi:hypothetical protein